MSNYESELNQMRWSFSRVKSSTNCKYEFYLSYIEKREGVQNIYAAFGKFCHNILEMYAKDELKKEELADYFIEYYQDEVSDKLTDATDDQLVKYYDLGLSYFRNCDLDLINYEILGVELKCEFKINGRNFVGYIDLLVKDKRTGEIIIIDHKSSAYPLGKRGKVKKAKEEDYISYKRQLYLYSIYVIDKFGIKPTSIAWNYFREQQWLTLPFIEEELEEAKQWATNTIDEIYKEEEFGAIDDFFYCRNLCNFRNSCEYKNY